MFCSNCGKTLKADMAKCPHCGSAIGESRFEGQPYTGAQKRIKPGEAVRLPGNHTKTTYMGSDASMEGDVETRTTYRATNEGAAPVFKAARPERLFNAEDEPAPAEEPIWGASGEEADYLTPENARPASSASEEWESENDDDEADYLTPENAQQDIPAPEEAEEPEDDEDEDIDFDREDREEEERLRAERKAEKKARREAKRAERRQREAEREAREDEELGEPIEDFDEEEERSRSSRRARRRAEKAAQAAPRSSAVEEEEDPELAAELAELRAREIEIVKPAGFSEDVNRYMSERRSEYEEKSRSATGEKEVRKKNFSLSFLKKRRKAEEDFDAEDDAFDLEEEDDFETSAEAFAAEDRAEYGEEAPEEAAPEAEEYDAEEEAQYVSDDGETLLSEDDAGAPGEFTDVDMDFDDEDDFVDEETLKRRRKAFQILKYAALAAVVVALIVGAVTLLSNIASDSKKSQIPNVSNELFAQGVELMQTRVGNDYISSRLRLYDASNSSTLAAVFEATTQDLDGLSSLMPANPDLNDQRFINALSAIQEDINNCLSNDILALSDTSKNAETRQRESDERWATVRAKVNILASATDRAQLDAIIKGERIEVIQQATPVPVADTTEEPYAKLSKGSKGEAVTKLQTRLTALGYMESVIDGDYGNKTKTAVQLFQKAAGLETTGIADVETQERLFAPDAPAKNK